MTPTKEQYELAAKAAGGMRSDSVEFDDDLIAVPMQLTIERE